MEDFGIILSAHFLAGLAVKIISAPGRVLKDKILGTHRERAVEECVRVAVLVICHPGSSLAKDDADHLQNILVDFFNMEDVHRELASLLRGNRLNREEITRLFTDSGYDTETSPSLNLPTLFTAFEMAFLYAAADNSELQGIIQTNQLLIQTSVQIEILEYIKNMLAFLQKTQKQSITIQNGIINAISSINKQKIEFSYPFPRIDSNFDQGWEHHYLRTLIFRYDQIDLTIFDETLPQRGSREDETSVRVSDIFTTLNLKGIKRTKKQTIQEVILPGKRKDKKFSEKEDELIPVQATEAVSVMNRLVILGEPGSGKSTLIHYIATQLAKRILGTRSSSEKLTGWSDDMKPMPVVVILRFFADWLPTDPPPEKAGLVWDYIQYCCETSGCKDAFVPLKKRFEDVGGIVFFDGLDEVRETIESAKRSLITKAIMEFSGPLHKCKIVISCREYAYKKNDAWKLPEPEFPVVELDLFNLSQIQQFARTWYSFIGPQKGWDQNKYLEVSDNLYQAIAENEHLEILGRYPLLLTLMAQMHGRDGYLPQDRADLYERAVNLLIALWDNRIIRDTKEGRIVQEGMISRLGITKDILRHSLEHLAFVIHEKQEQEKTREEFTAEIPRSMLLNELETSLKSLDKAKEVIDYIQQRTGLLIARDNYTYAFPHRTFQEFLAASYIMRRNYSKMLKERVKRDLTWWKEVFLLAGGLSKKTPMNIADIIDELLPFGPEKNKIDENKANFTVLCGQTIADTGFLDQQKEELVSEPGRYTVTFEKIINWLGLSVISDKEVSNILRCNSGNILSTLGDPRQEIMTLDGLKFCLVPAGPFFLGSGSKDKMAYDNEKPGEKKTLELYWISRFPVSNAQFNEFVNDDQGYRNKECWTTAGRKWRGNRKEPEKTGGVFDLPNHPVVMVIAP